MIITRLTFENFGVFRGQVDIDLSPRQLSDRLSSSYSVWREEWSW